MFYFTCKERKLLLSIEKEINMSKNHQSPNPVPAATILLLRPSDTQLEVFMVVRHHQIDFASGALVFPGGKADDQDFDDPPLELNPQNLDLEEVKFTTTVQGLELLGPD